MFYTTTCSTSSPSKAFARNTQVAVICRDEIYKLLPFYRAEEFSNLGPVRASWVGIFPTFYWGVWFFGFCLPLSRGKPPVKPWKVCRKAYRINFYQTTSVGVGSEPLEWEGGVWAAVSLVGYFRSFLWPERTGFWGRPPSFGFRCWIHTLTMWCTHFPVRNQEQARYLKCWSVLSLERYCWTLELLI